MIVRQSKTGVRAIRSTGLQEVRKLGLKTEDRLMYTTQTAWERSGILAAPYRDATGF